MNIEKKYLIIISGFILILSGSILTTVILIQKRDNIPPDIHFISPGMNEILSDTVLIKCNVSDQKSSVSQIEISIDNIVVTNSSEYYWDTTQVLDGMHIIQCVAQDSAENFNSKNISVIVKNRDDVPPEIQFISPNNKDVVSKTVAINCKIIDQKSNVSKIEILIDNILVSNTSSYLWDSTSEVDGAHFIVCTAQDSAGNVISENISIIVDNTNPIVSITSPINGTNIAGILSINMDIIEINEITSHKITVNKTLESTQLNYSWNTLAIANGWYEIECQATDVAGNIGTAFIHVYVNNSATIPLADEIIKVMTFNIKESGEDPSYPDWKYVVQEENADIIMFIETGTWDDNADAKLNQYISEFNTYFSDKLPYSGYALDASLKVSGIACLSRYPILHVNQISTVILDDASSYDVTHDFFDVLVKIDDLEIHVIGCHLKALTGAENEQRREWEQEGIINYMDSLGVVPIIYLGDFNSFSPEDWGINTDQSSLGYGPLSMLIPPYTSPETGSDYNSYVSTIHNWTDAHRALNSQDLGHSSPAYDSRIDFIYVNQVLAPYLINSTTGDTIHASTGSDHYCVDIWLDLTGESPDRIAPQIIVQTPADQTLVSDSILIAVEAFDLSGISSQTIKIDGNIVSSSASYLWDTTLYSDGLHLIQAEAIDTVGNKRIDIVEIIVDNELFVVINEFLPDPYLVYAEEWIELYNPLSTSVDLSGYIIDDVSGGGSSPFIIPEGTIIPAKGFLVFYQSTTGIYLNNGGDEVNFINPDGNIILDSYTYSYSSDDISWGRSSESSNIWTTFNSPTPGNSNI